MSNACVDFDHLYDETPMENIYPCSNIDVTYLNDINNQNYANGNIVFSSANMLGNSPDKYFSFSEGSLHIPYTYYVTITGGVFITDISGTLILPATPGTNTMPENTFACSLKGAHHLIDSMNIKMSGIGVNQQSAYQNFYVNENIKQMTTVEHKLFGNIMGHEFDNADSYGYNTTDVAAMPYENNNRIIPVTLATATATSGVINGLGNTANTYVNDGHLKRMTRTNVDNIHSSAYKKLINSDANKQGQSNLVGYSGNVLTFEGTAVIPLAYLSDFFKNLPSMSASTSFEFKLQSNIAASNTWQIGFTTTGTTNQDAGAFFKVASMNCQQGIGHTCPFMLSPAGFLSGNGLSIKPFTAAAGQTITATISAKIGNQTTLPCRICMPIVSLTPKYVSSILSSPISRVLYNDFYVDTILNVQGGTNVTRVLSSQLSRCRRLFILPYLATQFTNGTTIVSGLVSPYAQPLSSAPNTVSMCRLNQFQVSIGGQNIFSEAQHYTSDFYNNNYLQLMSKINGNSTKSSFQSGMITRDMWEKCYGTYVVNLERVSSEEQDNVKKNITVSFKVDTMSNIWYDFLILTEYQMELFVNRSLGTITSTADARSASMQ